MMDDVFEESIHCTLYATRRRWCVGPLQRAAQKAAEYSSHPVLHMPPRLRHSA
jgi:hypothetical protein